MRTARLVLILGLTLGLTSGTRGQNPGTDQVKAAVSKSLELLSHSAEEFTVHRDCFSCHHQALPVLALVMARKKGIRIKESVLAHQVEHTRKFFEANQKKFLDKAGTGGGVDTAGYGLLTLKEAGHPPDATTDAVIVYLLHRIKDASHFPCSSERPPSEISSFSTTFVGLSALSHFGRGESAGESEKARKRVEMWVGQTRKRDTEDLVFRLRSLELLPPNEKAKAEAVRDLLFLQRQDGGWPQNDWRESDAYATATALYTLRRVGALKEGDFAYQHGIKWLLKNQESDGSWKVESWSKPFQVYFETGFPHGKDQFISCTATAWAAMALMQTLP